MDGRSALPDLDLSTRTRLACARAALRSALGFNRRGLRDYLAAEHADISYAKLALSLGIAETVVKKQLHNLRERYRWLLRDEIAHTVASPADIDDEIRHLCAALAAAA